MGAVHFTQDFGRPPRETNSILELVHGVHLQSEAVTIPGISNFRYLSVVLLIGRDAARGAASCGDDQ